MLSIFLDIILFSVVHVACTDQIPEQVHLALGDLPSSLTITWVTHAPTPPSVVIFWDESQKYRVYGNMTMFTDGGEARRQIFMHRVILDKIEPNKTYTYCCGSEAGWSHTYNFRTLPIHSNWTVRLGIFGDMGVLNNRAINELIKEVLVLDNFDALIHVGDFAYDMHMDDGKLGDVFMRLIQPIAARIPYMTMVGNHESAYNFSNYKARFSMPGGDGESMFYSFNIGSVHVIGFASEAYYYLGSNFVHNQYEWLKRDLQKANIPKNRALRPWIIAMGHRPMYCSNNDDSMHCDIVDNLVRTGFPSDNQSGYFYGLEKLFYDQGVDIIIGAHEHSYERFWPVFNRKVCNGTGNNPYINPPAPVHIVTGSAGSSEGFDPFNKTVNPWSAVHLDEYGFTRMHVTNSTHIKIEQVSIDDNENATVSDVFQVIKLDHGPNLYNCDKK